MKHVVLIGGGHSHVEVLRRFGVARLAGARVTVIGRDRATPYSGMLPGLIAGVYTFEQTHIDLEPLCRFAGAVFRHDEVVGIDCERRLVLCRSGEAVGFDWLSVNIGSSPALGAIAGAAAYAVAVKPIGRFIEAWHALRARVAATRAPLHIAVIGAGAGGVEMVLALQIGLRQALNASGKSDERLRYTLIGQADHVLPGQPDGVRRRLERVLRARSITLITGQTITAVAPGRLCCADGASYNYDEILFVTSAGAAPWLASSGLALDARGFVAVEPTLRSLSHQAVFAVGDIATVIGDERPKSGVFAVRQGAPLTANLRRAIAGEPLLAFRPQRNALALISTGDRAAVASWRGWGFEGRVVWLWKDLIDRRFMRRYQSLGA